MDKLAETRIIEKLASRIDDMVVRSHTSKYDMVSKHLGELKREISLFRSDLVRDFSRLEKSVTDLEAAYKTNVLPNLSTWNNTATRYEDNVKWVSRLVIGAVLMALLGLILVKNT